MTNTSKSYVILLFCYLYLPLLFGLPIYYASQGSAFIHDAENYCSTYQQWLSGTIVPGASTVLQTSGSDSNQIITPTVLSPLDSPYNPLLKVDQAWNSYLESRLAEWKVLFTLACVFIAWVHIILCNLILTLYKIFDSKHLRHNLSDSTSNQRPAYTLFRVSRRLPRVCGSNICANLLTLFQQ
jgi:hypothetical protein